MPDGLAAAAYEMVHGAFTDDQRKGVFKPEIAVERRRVAAGEVPRVHRPRPRLSSRRLSPRRASKW